MSESPQGLWSPAVDVEEENGHVKVLAEMPGLKKEDIDVRVEGHSVVIKGEKKHETSGKENGYLRRERSYGSFYRRIELPEECDAQKIEASYKNGVLELTMPKRPEAQSKQVQIQVK
ncbi:MAG: Hsp20/alpha crystallin family protein [Elusimicrobia bacterium]|nr:Hsp20/alpha crystallin family protein [Elusimicrobiota bacterium]